MENFDQKIKHINIADDKKEFSVKGVKGAKAFLLSRRRENF